MSSAYRYSDYINPLVGRIADSLGSSNDAKARGIANAGQATARGQELSGLAWSRAASDIANTAAGAVQEYNSPHQQQARQQQADRASMDKAFSPIHAMGPQEEGTPTQLPTRDQILASLPGHLQGVAMKQFADADENAAKVTKARREYVNAMTDDLAGVRWTLEHWQGDPTVANMQIERLSNLYADDPSVLQGLNQAKQAIQQDPSPANILKIAGSLPTNEKYAALAKETAQKTREVRTVDDAGNEVIKIVPDEAGASYPVPPPKPPPEVKPPALGSFEDYVSRKYGANPTAQQIAAARKEYAVADNQTKPPKEPIDVTPDVQTTRSGRKYVDLSGFTGEERNRAREAANKAGVVTIGKEQANALQEIDNARANQSDIMTQIGDLLPKGAGGRVLAAPATALEKLFQTDAQKAAFGTWRTSAIQTLRATAGSKGLRINQAEIAAAIENDIPKLTDTWSTAQQKVKNVLTMLENAEKSILVRDRAAEANRTAPIKVGGFTVEIER